uniref:Tryptophan 2,3-dioxygenase n=1 Tax=Panagrolaimus sp. JU765 TaxID=591449 RepID=A0AC34Q5P6_9BILA
MACPLGYGSVRFNGGEMPQSQPMMMEETEMEISQVGVNKVEIDANPLTYTTYLQLDKLLKCQSLKSSVTGPTVPDEHLFIIIHQTYELWFKQIIFDIDQVRNLLNNRIVDETKTLQIVSLLERTVRILKLLADQILILETMSPLDFVEFRKYLTTASGFQSLQFRLLENKLGVQSDNRVKYNQQNYRQVFTSDEEVNALRDSETSPSLFQLVEKWLERTPGTMSTDNEETKLCDSVIDALTLANGNEKKETSIENEVIKDETSANKWKNNVKIDEESRPKIQRGFWPNYVRSVEKYLNDLEKEANASELTPEQRNQLQQEHLKTKLSFGTILSEIEYNKFLKKQERRLSHNALKGALMIYFYRDMPRFSQPYQILTFLMDIDSLLQKWRYNHVMLVQRMLGAKQGTGGSSGYLYLRTTVSDRYKIFLDLFNLSTWLIPRAYIPRLSPKMVRTLSHHANLTDRDATD